MGTLAGLLAVSPLEGVALMPTYELIQRVRKTPGGVLKREIPDWPTPVQVGLFGWWGDPALANLGGTSAYMFWDWPNSALQEAYRWPEVIPR